MLKINTTKIAPFLDKRIASIFLLGCLSGFPWVIIGSALTLWLKEAGISRTEIGYAALIYGVYAINFLWAPLLDRFQPHWFPKLGPRRTWVLGCQIILIGVCFVMSQFSPETHAKTLVLLALIIAIVSATQDVAIDAFRVDSFDPQDADKISAAAAASTAGWWSGYAGLGFIPLFLSDHNFTWANLFPVMAIISACLCFGLWLGHAPFGVTDAQITARKHLYTNRIHYLAQLTKLGLTTLLISPLFVAAWAVAGSPGLAPEVRGYPLYVPAIVLLEITLVIFILVTLARLPSPQNTSMLAKGTWLDSVPVALMTNVIAPLEDFFKRNGLKLGLTLLIFVVVFKLGEAFLGRMSIVFYKEVGFSNSEIATYSKMLTWWVTVAAAIPCGLLNSKLGLVKGLFFSGVFMAASNLLFALIAQVGPDLNLYFITAVVDGITTAWGSIAFVAFISALCSHTFSATQYALLASLGTLGRSSIAAFSGQMVDALGGNWSLFFIITTLMVIPGLIMLVWLSKRLKPILAKAPAN